MSTGTALSRFELYVDVALAKLNAQMQRKDSLDAKAAIVLTAATAILSLETLVLTLLHFTRYDGAYFGFAVGLAAYAFSLGATMKAIWNRTWSYRPDLSALREHIIDPYLDEAVLCDWVGQEFSESIAANEPQLAAKARLLRLALYASAVQALSFVSALLLTALR